MKAVTIDKNSTVLLMLDFNEQTCNMQRRPRCIESIPKVKKLLTAARTAGVPVVFTDTPYIEQYVAWHLANVPVIGLALTLTTIDQVTL